MIWNDIRAEVDQRKADVDYLAPNRYLGPIQLLINNLEGLCQAYYSLHVHPFGCNPTICHDNFWLQLGFTLECVRRVDLNSLAGEEILDL